MATVEQHAHRFERPASPLPGVGRIGRDFGGTYAANAVIGLIFAATGPVAVILAVGVQGGLTPEELASWMFGSFLINGVITIIGSWLYRQPLGFFWTIPGTVLVGPALGHLSFPQVIGAFYATGLLILLLGLSGWVRRAMAAIPMPIVMAMVAAVFLKFGTGIGPGNPARGRQRLRCGGRGVVDAVGGRTGQLGPRRRRILPAARCEDGRDVFLDARETSRRNRRRPQALPRCARRSSIPTSAENGPWSAGIPGLPAALVDIARKYGTPAVDDNAGAGDPHGARGLPGVRAPGERVRGAQRTVMERYAGTRAVYLADGDAAGSRRNAASSRTSRARSNARRQGLRRFLSRRGRGEG